jgi:hypothetical protein
VQTNRLFETSSGPISGRKQTQANPGHPDLSADETCCFIHGLKPSEPQLAQRAALTPAMKRRENEVSGRRLHRGVERTPPARKVATGSTQNGEINVFYQGERR